MFQHTITQKNIQSIGSGIQKYQQNTQWINTLEALKQIRNG